MSHATEAAKAQCPKILQVCDAVKPVFEAPSMPAQAAADDEDAFSDHVRTPLAPETTPSPCASSGRHVLTLPQPLFLCAAIDLN